MWKKLKSKISSYIYFTSCIKQNKKNLKQINKNLIKDKIKVVFICQLPSLWNSVKSVYESILNNDKIEALIVAIPEKKRKKETDYSEEYEENKSFLFLSEKGYKVINGYENNKFLDLRDLTPDYVFIPRPYDSLLPDLYSSANLSTFTRVCYVTYGFSLTKDCMPTIFNFDFLKNVYLFFPDSKASESYVKKIYKKHFCNWNKIGPIGYPRFDLLQQVKLENTVAKVFLWTPRWTSNENVCGTTFFDYIDKLIDFFKKHPDLTLVFRPHPLLFKNFLMTGEISQDKYELILESFDKNQNLCFDNPENDYIETFNKVDVMITDPTSLLPEFYYTGKPIIYTAIPDNFNSSSKVMEKGLYMANNWSELKEKILSLADGKDPLLAYRIESLKLLNKTDNNGDSICRTLIKEYFKDS